MNNLPSVIPTVGRNFCTSKIFEVYKRNILIVGAIILISILIFNGFKKNEKILIVGSYESFSPSLLEKAKFAVLGIECFNAGRKLKLSSDSNFVLVDYEKILTGRWFQKKDLINLHFISTKYVNDSMLNKLGTLKVPSEDYLLKWNNPDLYYFFTNSRDKCVEIFK